MNICPRCKSEVPGRKRYCNDNCKYWYNQIKKQEEKGMPPVKKRNKNFFFMVTGSQWSKGSSRQGKRINGMIMGSMSARVEEEVGQYVEATKENLKRHFFGNSFEVYVARFGDGSRLTKKEFLEQSN